MRRGATGGASTGGTAGRLAASLLVAVAGTASAQLSSVDRALFERATGASIAGFERPSTARAGPAVIELGRFFPGHAPQVWLRTYLQPIPHLDLGGGPAIEVSGVFDAAGTALHAAPNSGAPVEPVELDLQVVPRPHLVGAVPIALKPGTSAAQVERIAGNLRLAVPVDVVAIALSRDDVGIEKGAGEIRLTLTTLEAGVAELSVRAGAERVLGLRGYDSQDEEVAPRLRAVTREPERDAVQRIRVAFSAPVARIDALIAGRRLEQTFAFSLIRGAVAASVPDLPMAVARLRPPALVALPVASAPTTVDQASAAPTATPAQARAAAEPKKAAAEAKRAADQARAEAAKKAASDARAKAEAKKAAADAKRAADQARAEERAQARAQAKQKAAAEARARAEARKAAAQAKQAEEKSRAIARAKAQAEAKAAAEAKARAVAQADAKRKAEADAQDKAAAEVRARAEADRLEAHAAKRSTAEPRAPVTSASPQKPPRFNDLVTAVWYRDHGAARQLLDLGKWVDRADSDRMTPLMHAVRLRDERMVRLLLSRGADPNAVGPPGKTQLSIAREQADAAIEALLRSAGAR